MPSSCVCPSACTLCVCVSVTVRYCIKTAKRRITQIMPHDRVRCFVVAGFLLTSASRSPSAIAEPLVRVNCGNRRGLFSLGADLSQDLLDKFFTVFGSLQFAPYDSYWIADDQSTIFSLYLTGRCHGNHQFAKLHIPLICHTGISNWM